MRRSLLLIAALVALAAARSPHAQQASGGESGFGAPVPVLVPTLHPSWPRDLTQLWLAPEAGTRAARSGAETLAQAVRLIDGHEYTRALTLLSEPGLRQGPLAQYVTYYTGVAQLRSDRAADALKTFKALRAEKPAGYLSEGAAYGVAEAALALEDPRQAVAIYEDAVRGKPSRIEDALLRLGRAYKAAGDSTKAAETFVRLYYEFAMSDEAAEAGIELSMLGNLQPMTPGSQRYTLELGRAERLFGARQYGPARAAFETLSKVAAADDRELVQLRLAECDFMLGRYRAARDRIRPFAARATRQAEAMFFFASASRQTGDTATFLSLSHRIADEFPTESWAEDALNALGTYYIRTNQDDKADEIFRQMYERFPRGNYAERAAWKAGWRAYRARKYADTIRFFEGAAADFPRSDYRPSWLYWAGRAHEALGEQEAADQRYEIVIADYLNTYYGRVTMAHLGARGDALKARVLAARAAVPAPPAPPLPENETIVRTLLAAGLYDAAMNELQYARRVYGNSPAIEATVAWASQQRSRDETGMERFQLLRGAINAMRRAYPQFMTVEGTELPRDVQTVIFPIAYWELIKKHAAANGIDPYLMAALVAQESTFVADIRSHANAYGLTQLLPSTARQYAAKLNLRYSTRLLTDPDANLRIGARYFADKIREFGDIHLALASYNAGERPVRQWKAEKPDLPRDEFIDDIPYPETQQYVRKIIGTAEDYRRLYGGGAEVSDVLDKTPSGYVAPAAPKPASKPAPKAAAPAKKKPTPKVTPSPRKPRAKASKR